MRKTEPGGGKPDKLVRDALKAALRQDTESLKAIAENWVTRAKTDQVAANALADRLDGKPSQQVTLSGDDENPIIQRIERLIVDPANSNAEGIPPAAAAGTV